MEVWSRSQKETVPGDLSVLAISKEPESLPDSAITVPGITAQTGLPALTDQILQETLRALVTVIVLNQKSLDQRSLFVGRKRHQLHNAAPPGQPGQFIAQLDIGLGALDPVLGGDANRVGLTAAEDLVQTGILVPRPLRGWGQGERYFLGSRLKLMPLRNRNAAFSKQNMTSESEAESP
eukprot:g48333.t1